MLIYGKNIYIIYLEEVDFYRVIEMLINFVILGYGYKKCSGKKKARGLMLP